jgi:DNA-binding protein YbaB
MANADEQESSLLLVDDVSTRLQQFVDNRQIFEAMTDNLVRVRVGPSMNVLAVEILDSTLAGDRRSALEVACASAVNAALQKAAIAAGQALAEIAQKIKVHRMDALRTP